MLYTEFALVAGLTQLFTPIVILTSYSSLSHVDAALEEAARGLGAGPGRAFRRVVLPLALPGVLVGATLAFAGAITAFTTPLLLGGHPASASRSPRDKVIIRRVGSQPCGRSSSPIRRPAVRRSGRGRRGRG